MEFKLDRTKKYALALEGGGGRGAYEIGAWKALHEEGIGFCAVSGTSVGAINGAAVTAGDLDTAIHFWENLTYSQVMDVDAILPDLWIRRPTLYPVGLMAHFDAALRFC